MNVKYDSTELMEEVKMGIRISGKDSIVNVVSIKVGGFDFIIDYYGGNGEYDGRYLKVKYRAVNKMTLNQLLEKLIIQISNI